MPDSAPHKSDSFNWTLTDHFHIGPVRLANRLVQAPMAGVTGRAFRLQALRFGAGLAATEMVSSYGIHYRNRRTTEMLKLTAAEHPVVLQLFGDKPAIMAEAAVAAEQAGADIIDINMGCSVRKVVKTGAGVALMKNEDLAAGIMAAMVDAVSVPVIAKMRAGFSRVTAPSMARRMAAAGAAAIGIHPRTGLQGWRGRADHAVTARVAGEVDIPVIASGDVNGAEDLRLLLAEAGAAAVMVGRAALGNPWIYGDMLAGRKPHRRDLPDVLTEMGRFYEDVKAEMGEDRARRHMRKFYGWYLAPFAPRGELRSALLRAESFDEAVELAGRELA
ncbi:MAG: tRNA-dihydrouridine synthase [Thermoleophilia bacterium]|nr:tRNA-dihydrouridine synthase [Thermoleophilia bacterium]